MMKVNFIKQRGSVNGFMAVAILLLAISLPVTVLLVQKNQENRSNAASEVDDYSSLDEEDGLTDVTGACGGADGKNYASRPTNDLCTSGSVLWRDSSGNDGNYLWSCIGENDADDMASVDCSATKLSKEEGGSIDGRCGDANGMDQNSKPISNYVLCKAGELAWTDEVADDGDFNWSCEGINGGSAVNCLAFKTEE